MKQLTGSFGAIIAGACCLGLPPLIAVLTGVGMGFILHDAILIPLLIIILGFTLWSLNASKKKHAKVGPLYLGAGMSILAFSGLWILTAVSWLGFIGLISVSIWDVFLIKRLNNNG